MGYNLKTPWDLAEFKKEAIPHIAPIAGSSSFVDLKLGRFGDPGEGLVDNFKAPRTYMMESASCGSSRRARARLNGTQTASCLVDGCRSDLSACRDYHRRHKVCEVHSKTPIVTIAGQEKRFCQQCSRFHSLVEFDEGKRSCRKRLDGHNRRRRKPQPESLSLNAGRFHFNHHQGARYLPFGRPQVCSTGSVDSSVWAGGVVKAESDPVLNDDSHSLISFSERKSMFPGILSHSYKGGKQFPFLQGGVSSALAGDSVNQPVLDPNSVLGNGSSNQKMFTDGLHRVFNSDCALSLLSSPPAKTREVGFNPMSHLNPNPNPNPSPPSHSLIPTFQHYNNLRPHVDHAASILVSEGSSSASLHSQEMFHIGLDGSSSSMSHPHQTLSFSWE